MNKPAERPPILSFMLSFIGLIAAVLSLAMLSPTSASQRDDVSALDGCGGAQQAKGTGSAAGARR